MTAFVSLSIVTFLFKNLIRVIGNRSNSNDSGNRFCSGDSNLTTLIQRNPRAMAIGRTFECVGCYLTLYNLKSYPTNDPLSFGKNSPTDYIRMGARNNGANAELGPARQKQKMGCFCTDNYIAAYISGTNERIFPITAEEKTFGGYVLGKDA
jgi:hypothetical protein